MSPIQLFSQAKAPDTAHQAKTFTIAGASISAPVTWTRQPVSLRRPPTVEELPLAEAATVLRAVAIRSNMRIAPVRQNERPPEHDASPATNGRWMSGNLIDMHAVASAAHLNAFESGMLRFQQPMMSLAGWRRPPPREIAQCGLETEKAVQVLPRDINRWPARQKHRLQG